LGCPKYIQRDVLWSGLIWLRIGTNGRLFELRNEASVCVTGGEFLDQLRNYYLIKKDSASWRYLVYEFSVNERLS
jgi:hypothetical protein